MKSINEDYLDNISSDTSDIMRDVELASTYQIVIAPAFSSSLPTDYSDTHLNKIIDNITYIFETIGNIEVVSVKPCSLLSRSKQALFPFKYTFTLYGHASLRDALRLNRKLISSADVSCSFNILDISPENYIRLLNNAEVSPQFIHLMHILTGQKHIDIFNYLQQHIHLVKKYTMFTYTHKTQHPYFEIDNVYDNIDDYLKATSMPEELAKSNLIEYYRDCLSENTWDDDSFGNYESEYIPIDPDETDFSLPSIIITYKDDAHYFNMTENEDGSITTQTSL